MQPLTPATPTMFMGGQHCRKVDTDSRLTAAVVICPGLGFRLFRAAWNQLLVNLRQQPGQQS